MSLGGDGTVLPSKISYNYLKSVLSHLLKWNVFQIETKQNKHHIKKQKRNNNFNDAPISNVKNKQRNESRVKSRLETVDFV